jgi:hypothetical protein
MAQQVVTGLLLRRLGFDPKSVHAVFVVEKMSDKGRGRFKHPSSVAVLKYCSECA